VNKNEFVLAVEHLGVEVKQKTLLSDITFKLRRGQILSVIGPNGAGKSTLLRSVGGEFPKHAGSILIHSQPRERWSPRQLARQFASLSQHSSLDFPFTVREVVALSRLPHAEGKKVDDDIVDMLMTTMDIQMLAQANYVHLSGGEKQRVQLARVIAQLYPLNGQDKLLLLDEPCAGLDLKHQKLLAETLTSLRDTGMSVVMTAHDLNWAIAISDEFLALRNGKMLACGNSEQVAQQSVLEDLFDVPLSVLVDKQSRKTTVSVL
jgi:iron complex transport system ATP-binding protein